MIKRVFLLLALLVVGALGSIAINGPGVQAQPVTTGTWQAQFYPNTNFSGTPIPASYSAINFNWGTGSPTNSLGQPLAGIPADNFSAIFTSTQTLAAGTYNFNLIADDRARVTLNGVQIFDVTVPSPEAVTQQVVLPGGAVNLRIEYVELTDQAYLQLTSSAFTNAPVPGGPTFTPAPTLTPTITPLPPIPPGAITATVIRASVLNVRDAPSLGGNRIGRILRGQTYAVVGRDTDARWFLLQLAGYQGWAYGYYLFIDGNEFTPPVVSGNTVLGLAGQPDTGVRAQTEATMRLRAAPTVASRQIGRVTWGAFLPVTGKTADGFWYQVVWKDTVGWVYSPFVEVIEGDLNNVPVR